MGENEKLGFTFEVAPYDFRTFNRFFGATTPWVESEKSATIPWNGSQRPNSEDYLKVREVVAPKGTEVIPKEEFMQELGGKPHEIKFDIPNCKVSYKDGQIVVDELTAVSEDTLKKWASKAVWGLRENMCKTIPLTFNKPTKPTKRNKHYKPKFTL